MSEVSTRSPHVIDMREAGKNNDAGSAFTALLGASPAMEHVRTRIRQYARERAPILITGETGSGKELIARALHELSGRAKKRFVPVNVAAIPETLAASELFGHVKGSFTGASENRHGAFAEADKGTIFLDELGEMPAPIQAQLLRVLDNRRVSRIGEHKETEVDFRLITATNKDLETAVSDKEFRSDLFFRVGVLTIHAPSLRERTEDIAPIAEAYLRQEHSREDGPVTLSDEALKHLQSYDFPGNVRELRGVLARAVCAAKDGVISADDIEFGRRSTVANADAPKDIAEAREVLTDFMVIRALEKTRGNVSQAAKLTGLSRASLHKIKQKFDHADARELSAEGSNLASKLERLIHV